MKVNFTNVLYILKKHQGQYEIEDIVKQKPFRLFTKIRKTAFCIDTSQPFFISKAKKCNYYLIDKDNNKQILVYNGQPIFDEDNNQIENLAFENQLLDNEIVDTLMFQNLVMQYAKGLKDNNKLSWKEWIIYFLFGASVGALCVYLYLTSNSGGSIVL